MEIRIPPEELPRYLQSQRNHVAEIYGECNEVNLRKFINSGASESFRQEYVFAKQAKS